MACEDAVEMATELMEDGELVDLDDAIEWAAEEAGLSEGEVSLFVRELRRRGW